ncbi:transposase [Streptomyces olivaceoviridis]|uniref:transposase n=1 Tax=Streptomyces olivaceoviridis TaxID=1921 RepID=UPI0036FF924E
MGRAGASVRATTGRSSALSASRAQNGRSPQSGSCGALAEAARPLQWRVERAWPPYQRAPGGGSVAVPADHRQVTCPNGATSSRWAEDRSQEGTAVVRARFPTAACRPCKAREQCTRPNTKWDMGRRITLRPQAEYEAIQQARAQEDTQDWIEQYTHRAGVEGTISQGVRCSAYDDVAITAWPKPDYSTSSSRQR